MAFLDEDQEDSLPLEEEELDAPDALEAPEEPGFEGFDDPGPPERAGFDDEPATGGGGFDEPPSRRGGFGEPPSRPPRTPRQQIMLRRMIALGGGVLVLILIVVAFRGCLQARKERAIKNFVSDVGAVMGESDQVGQDFFGLLDDSSGRTPLEYEAEVKSFRGASETLYDRAQNVDAPGELSGAKNALILTLQLRRNGLTEIGDNIGQALGEENAVDAQQAIADQMQLLLASDAVCSGVALPEIVTVVDQEGIAGGESTDIPCMFVPEPVEQWLDDTAISDAFSQVTGDTATTPGLHGLELVTTKVGDVDLTEGTPATVPSANPELTVEVTNGGESEETDVSVSAVVGGDELTASIPTVGAGETTEVNIPISPIPASGEQTTIEVTVEPVPGEELTDNNSASYTVTFE